MLKVHGAKVTILQKVLVVNLSSLGLVKLLYQLLDLSVRHLHLGLRKALDECVVW